MTTPIVILTGPPGAGKTTIAGLLAKSLAVAVRDTDQDVERIAGKPISDIFVEDGEAHFRELEREAVASAIHDHDGVLALGGGSVLHPMTQEVLADYATGGGTIVFLDVSLAQAVPRVGLNKSRPLLLGNPRAQWQQLMTSRRPIYEKVATLRIDTDELTPQNIVDVIIASLASTTENP